VSIQSTNSTPGYDRATPLRSSIARTALYLGALALLGTGVDHIQQYYGGDYSSVPTIGTLFFLNFVSAVVVTAGLVAPLGRIAGHYAGTIRDVFAVCGIGIAVGSLAGLLISESSGLFGFVEHGYRTPIALAIVAEVAATCFLLLFLAASGERSASAPRREANPLASRPGGSQAPSMPERDALDNVAPVPSAQHPRLGEDGQITSEGSQPDGR
jgi:hypothetical protein